MNRIQSNVLSLLLMSLVLAAAAAPAFAGATPVKPKVSPEKAAALDWLSRPETVETFGRISDAIWKYAELGLQEFQSSKLLADTLEAEGFTVERGVAGMPTAFVATYGSGKPVIALLGEYDALPSLSQKARVTRKDPVVDGAPGHGCGPNTMGTAATAAAIAVKKAMASRRVPGTIRVFGSPAEEFAACRPYFVRAGLFRDVDAVIDNHAGEGFGTEYGTYFSALYSAIFTFKGRTAHAAGEPWLGRSALDAVEIMDVAVNFLREHLPLTQRTHYVILEGGQAPNVVPDRARVHYLVRDTDGQLEETFRRVVDCARAGALAAGVELESVQVLNAMHQVHANKAAAELFQQNIDLVGMPVWSEGDQAFARALQKELGAKEDGMPSKVEPILEAGEDASGGSSDTGDVSLVAPMATIFFPGMVPHAIGHHWSTVASFSGSTAWYGLNAGAKAIAASAIDLLTKPEELAKLKAEFEVLSKTHPYKSFLPADALPPIDFYKERMDRYRPLLEKAFSEKPEPAANR